MRYWWAVVVCMWACGRVSGEPVRSFSPRDLERPGRIVGGEPVEEGKFAWTVSLQRRNRHFCCGTLVDKEWVITAAHCMSGEDPKDITVLTGIHNLDDRSLSRSHKIVHVCLSGYDPFLLQNDIALLRIKEDEETASRTDLRHSTPIAIETRKDFGIGMKALISGWGRTSYGGESTKILLAAPVEVKSDSECRKMFKKADHSYDKIHDSNICAGGRKTDACQGDSGGPLVLCDDRSRSETCRLAGVTSWGIECATFGVPGVYTEVAYFKKDIKNCVKDFKSEIRFYDDFKSKEKPKHLTPKKSRKNQDKKTEDEFLKEHNFLPEPRS